MCFGIPYTTAKYYLEILVFSLNKWPYILATCSFLGIIRIPLVTLSSLWATKYLLFSAESWLVFYIYFLPILTKLVSTSFPP